MANTRQKLMGGAAIGIAALAFYLGTQFKGLGPGGTGTGFGTTASGTSEGQIEAPPTADLAGDESVSVAGSATAIVAEPELLTVVMAGDGYLVTTTGDTSKASAADLADVARAAQSAKGDAQGIRVRVYQRKDATAGVLDDLKRKLEQVGVPAEAVQYMETPLE